MREKGFALATTLVIAVVVLIMGMAGMYMTEMGFRSITSESRWHLAEKAANAGIMEATRRRFDGAECANIGGTMNYNGASVEVQTADAGGACFVWSRATIGNARVVKVAVLTARTYANLGAANFLELDGINLGGSGAIASCEEQCRTSALLTGNLVQNPPRENEVQRCPNNPRGTTALVDPYVPSAFPPGTDLTRDVFDGARNRAELLDLLSRNFGVSFATDGRPSLSTAGLPQECVNNNFSSCTASGNTISCGSGNNAVSFVWNGTAYEKRQGNATQAICERVNLGNNANLSFSGTFTGGGVVSASNVNLGNGTVNGQNLTLVASGRVEDGGNGLRVNNVNVFAYNIHLNDRNIRWNGGLLYTGGGNATSCSDPPANGCFYIDLNSQSALGSEQNPVLIITDNNMVISRNGTAEINGLVFATSNSRQFSIGSGNGTFDINGMLIVNSTGQNANNRIDISGNFEIWFNSQVVRNLSNMFSFVKPPLCANVTAGVPFIQTKTTTY
ncbi:MAG: hypothetical protein WHS43_07475 [Aquificaceae bacterium]|jgi:hypothetical protein|uniref:hypothetical protein n=1 Tax=Hydrogenobacter sp. Uz 6-8 TaxID=3384828 RepID=UPI0030984684